MLHKDEKRGTIINWISHASFMIFYAKSNTANIALRISWALNIFYLK